MMDRIPKTGEFYRHFKDKLYQIVTVAEHTETGEPMVVYQALYGDYRTYARPLSMFGSEVDHEKYPQVSQKYRFEKVTMEAGVEKSEVLSQEIRPNGLNPHLLLFIEAENWDQKLEQLKNMRGKITQEEMDIIYTCEDLNPIPGEVEEQLRGAEQYLMMQKQFEGRRLR